MFKQIVGVVACAAAVIAIAFTLELGGLEWKKFFAPRHAAVEREVFKETRSFNEAKLQELTKYRLEYMRSKDPSDQAAIAATIRMSFADYDSSKLPHELQTFVDQVRYN